MWGASSADGKLTGDLGNAIEATPIGGRRSDRLTAGGCRSNISVAASFVWRCVSGSIMTPFPHPALLQFGDSPLRVRHDERADRAVVTALPDADMAIVVLAWLDLLTLEQVACRDVEPAGTCLHQLIAGDGEAIHIAAAGYWIPGMCECLDREKQNR
jgi:hypothetical protein